MAHNKHGQACTRNTNNSGIRFIGRFTMNNIAPKLQHCWTHKIAFNIIPKMLKQPNFFYSQPSTLPKDTPAKFYLSTTFDFSFMISFVALTRSSTSYAHLITKLGNCNPKRSQLGSQGVLAIFTYEGARMKGQIQTQKYIFTINFALKHIVILHIFNPKIWMTILV